MSCPVFTCISCRVAFAIADMQRAHYKSDWHRYNLKRKVAELPPITSAEFEQRVLAQQSKSADEGRDTSMNCTICGKHFGTENAYTNHLQSKKHKDAEAKANAGKCLDNRVDVAAKNAKNKEEQAAVDGYEEQKMMREGTERKKEKMAHVSTKPASSLSSNPRRGNEAAVSQIHSNEATLDEVEDAEEAEWEDVEGEELPTTACLFCSHSSSSMEDNLCHMTSTHSFFIPNIEYLVDMEGLLMYLGVKVGLDFLCLWCNSKGRAFFSVDSVQRHMRDKGHCKLLYEGDVIYEYSDFYDFRKSYPDFDEKNDGAVGGDVDMEDDDDEDIDDDSLVIHQEGFELVLPSGAKLGHRDLAKYYRQNLPLERKAVKRNPALIGRLMNQYKALGWHGKTGEASQKMICDLRYVQVFRKRQQLAVQTKANKLQKHFRSQNPI